MATCSIPNRHAAKLTRAQVIAKHNPIVSDDDAAKGLTLWTAKTLGVSACGGHMWLDFDEADNMVRINVYGVVSEVTTYNFGIIIGIKMFSEHEYDFSYHEFPVDVHHMEPTYKQDGWEGFVQDGYLFPYDRANNSFYIHKQIEDNGEQAFLDLIAEIKEEYNTN